jgi:hypothetical protein
MPTKGFPQLQKLYGLYGAEKNVSLFARLEFGHNYNFPSRDAMYRFMNEHLKLGHKFDDEPIEKPFKPLTKDEMTVWTSNHAKPTGDNIGDVFERKLLREMDQRSQAQLAALPVEKRREIVRDALKAMIGRTKPAEIDIHPESFQTPDDIKAKLRFTDTRSGLTVTGIGWHPTGAKEFCIFVSKNGASDYINDQGKPIGEAEKCLSAGKGVVVLDLYGRGDKPLEKAPIKGYGDGKQPWQKSLAYDYGYNPTVFAKRVHDLMSVMSIPKQPGNKITLYGLHGGAAYAAVARALLGDVVDELIVDTEGFRFANIESLDDVNMLPGIVKYGDLPAILDLSDPKTTIIRGEK